MTEETAHYGEFQPKQSWQERAQQWIQHKGAYAEGTLWSTVLGLLSEALEENGALQANLASQSCSYVNRIVELNTKVEQLQQERDKLRNMLVRGILYHQDCDCQMSESDKPEDHPVDCSFYLADCVLLGLFDVMMNGKQNSAIETWKDKIAELKQERDSLKEQLEVADELGGSFFEALKPLNLTHINVQNPGAHVTALIQERDRLKAAIDAIVVENAIEVGLHEIAEQKLARLVEAAAAQLKFCSRCYGHGKVMFTEGAANINPKPCEDCTPLRDVLRDVQGKGEGNEG